MVSDYLQCLLCLIPCFPIQVILFTVVFWAMMPTDIWKNESLELVFLPIIFVLNGPLFFSVIFRISLSVHEKIFEDLNKTVQNIYFYICLDLFIGLLMNISSYISLKSSSISFIKILCQAFKIFFFPALVLDIDVNNFCFRC